MIPVILSGGSGSRLWPVSRENYPKQFCELFDQSFLRNTYERVKAFGSPYIVTLDTMAALTQKSLSDTGFTSDHLVLEPFGKNTATAIARILFVLRNRVPKDEVIGVFPADHVIDDISAFNMAVHMAEAQAKEGYAVTLGVQPRYPSTGFGYIEIEEVPSLAQFPKAFRVKRFTEKPDTKTAQSYLKTKRHFWNAGIFFFTIGSIEKLLETYMPELWSKMSALREGGSNLKHIYANIQAQSIDYGVMEKAEKLICIPGDYGWSDVGSWDEIARLEEESAHLRVESKAQIFNVDSENNFVFSSEPKVIGLTAVSDLVVVDTPDALLITRKGHAQDVKKLVEEMREAHVSQAVEHRFEVRPWGRFEILSDTDTHKVKRIIVDPKQQMSYQMHMKRDEHWVVISGQAEIRMEDVKHTMLPGEQIKVLRGQKHRIKNSGDVPLVLVEIQTGAYFGEDDIERFEDDYNRA